METHMKYMLLIYGDESGFEKMSQSEGEKAMAAFMAYTEAVKKAGIFVDSNRLRPTNTASTVTMDGGKTKVLDGPYAETKEQLGGYFMINVPDLDAAISWAARCPATAYGRVEVRPVWVM
jgi:hypothetical protein